MCVCGVVCSHVPGECMWGWGLHVYVEALAVAPQEPPMAFLASEPQASARLFLSPALVLQIHASIFLLCRF